jgi:tetratricopeptide (TPR) repeat protein
MSNPTSNPGSENPKNRPEIYPPDSPAPILDLTCPALPDLAASSQYNVLREQLVSAVELLGDGDIEAAQQVMQQLTAFAEQHASEAEESARPHIAIGTAYWAGIIDAANGDFASGTYYLMQAVDFARQTHSDQSPHYALCLSALANTQLAADRPEEAKSTLLSHLPRLLDSASQWGPYKEILEDVEESIRDIAFSFYNSGDYRTALEVLQSGIPLVERSDGPASAEMALWRKEVGDCFTALDQPERGIQELEEALTIYGALPPTTQDPEGEVSALASLGRACVKGEQLKRAIEVHDRCLTKFREIAHPDTNLQVMVLHSRALLSRYVDDVEEAVAFLDDTIALHQSLDSQNPGALYEQYLHLGESLESLGRFDRAVQCFGQMCELTAESYGAESEAYFAERLQFASRLVNYGSAGAGLGVVEKLEPLAQNLFGLDTTDYAYYQITLANFYRTNDDLERCENLLRQALSTLDAPGNDDSEIRRELYDTLALTLAEIDQPEDALEMREKSLELCLSLYPVDSLEVAMERNRLGRALLENDLLSQALEQLEEAEAAILALPESDHDEIVNTYYFRGQVELEQDHLLEALESFESALEAFHKQNSPARDFLASLHSQIGHAALAAAMEILDFEFPDPSLPDPAPLLQQAIEAFDTADLIATETGKEWYDHAVADRKFRVEAAEMLEKIDNDE